MMSSFKIFTVLLSFVFLGQACTLQFSQSEETGIFKSVTGGRTWKQKSIIHLLDGTVTRIADLDITKIIVDPRNTRRIFFGTTNRGLFASENAGEEWTQLLDSQYILDIAQDPTARCVLFITTPNSLLRTTDCSQSWEVLYRETRGDVILRTIAIDYADPATVYLATSGGELFKSTDGGVTWRMHYRGGGSFAKLLIDRYNPQVMTIGSSDGTVIRSQDRGVTWADVTNNLRDFSDSHSFRLMEQLGGPDHILLVSEQGLFKTVDGGKEWKRVIQLTPAESAPIFVAGANMNDDQEIFYGTRSTYYHTVDDGGRWFALPLPSGTIPSTLAVDPSNPAIQYLGFRKDRRRLEPYWYYGPEQWY